MMASTSSSSSSSLTWPHSWDSDNPRTVQPLLATFAFGKNQEQRYGLYGLSLPLWTEMTAWMLWNVLTAVAVGTVLYYSIVLPSTQRKQQQQQQHVSTTAIVSTAELLWGYAILVPFWIVVPFQCLQYSQVTNLTFRFVLYVFTPTVCLFRTTQALHGFLPIHAVGSLSNFLLYFACPVLLKYDDKVHSYCRASWKTVGTHAVRFLFFLIALSAYTSLFSCVAWFPPLGGGTTTTTATPPYGAFWSSWKQDVASIWFDWAVWKDSILYAILFQCMLSTLYEGIQLLVVLVTGLETIPLMNNPIFTCTSPSDFWGRKWNLLIHDVLKQGVYKPVRSLLTTTTTTDLDDKDNKNNSNNNGSNMAAVVATFVASGLFHENLLSAVFVDTPVHHGKNMIFFAWQAVLVTLETVLVGMAAAATATTTKATTTTSKQNNNNHHKTSGSLGIAQYARLLLQALQSLPHPIRSVGTVLLGLPVAHLFCQTYVSTLLFVHTQMMLFSILPLPPSEQLPQQQ